MQELLRCSIHQYTGKAANWVLKHKFFFNVPRSHAAPNFACARVPRDMNHNFNKRLQKHDKVLFGVLYAVNS